MQGLMQPADLAQSVLAPAGLAADAIAWLWRLMLWTSVAVFAAVIGTLIIGIIRSVRRHPESTTVSPRTLACAITAAMVATVVVLLDVLVASVWTGSRLARQPSSALTIDVTGHQWWWEIQYEDPLPNLRQRTAYEIHIPIGRPVVIKVESQDVIHSFWAPNLQGKRDLIPGYVTAIWMQGDREGRFRGQCAEFCGNQHAHMAFDLVVESAAAFEQWRVRMQQAAPEPKNGAERDGRAAFMHEGCATCHTIRGTPA